MYRTEDSRRIQVPPWSQCIYFLQALTDDAKLYSYDISDVALQRATEEFAFDPRFTFFHKSQTEFDWNDVDKRPIDFVFFDAAHELDLNQATFEKARPALAPDAIIAIHDTGTWAKAHFGTTNQRFAERLPGGWINAEEYAHQPDERRFVDWIIATYPEFGSLHLHSKNTIRHGITLLQRQVRLIA